MDDVCQYCEQEPEKCPCDKVDRFFNDNWHLMHITYFRQQYEYKLAYIVPKKDGKVAA